MAVPRQQGPAASRPTFFADLQPPGPAAPPAQPVAGLFTRVGPFGTPVLGASSGAISPSFPQTPTPGNLIIFYVSGYTGGALTQPSTPAGYQRGPSVNDANRLSTFFYKRAQDVVGAEASPTIAATAGMQWSGVLAEFSSSTGFFVIDKMGAKLAFLSPCVLAGSAPDRASGQLVIYMCAERVLNNATAAMASAAPTNFVTNDVTNNATSTQCHFLYGYGITTADAVPDAVSITFEQASSNGVGVLVSFATALPVTAPVYLPRRMGPQAVGPTFFASLQAAQPVAVAAGPLNLTASTGTAIAGGTGTALAEVIVAQAGDPCAVASGGAVTGGKTAILTDNFTTLDSGKWNFEVGPVSVEAGRLKINRTFGYPDVESVGTYDFTGSYVLVQIDAPIPPGSYDDAWLQVAVPGGGGVQIGPGQHSSVPDTVPRLYVNGTDLGAYDSVQHAWVRVREAAGTTFADTSPDGLTWTNVWSGTPFAAAPRAVTVALVTGSDDVSSTRYSYFDNLNLPPVSLVAATGTATATGGTASLTDALPAQTGTATGGGGTALRTPLGLTASTGTATATGSASIFTDALAASTGAATGGGTASVFTDVLAASTGAATGGGGTILRTPLGLAASTGTATASGTATVFTDVLAATGGAATGSGGTATASTGGGPLSADTGTATASGTATVVTEALAVGTGTATAGATNVPVAETLTAATGMATGGGGTILRTPLGLTASTGTATASGTATVLTDALAASTGIATAVGGIASATEALAAAAGIATAGGTASALTDTLAATTGTATANGGTSARGPLSLLAASGPATAGGGVATATSGVAVVVEFDTARALRVVKTRAIVAVTETDTARALTVSRNRVFALVAATETDTARALGITKALVRVTETEVARALVAVKSRAIVAATEVDGARALTINRNRVVALVVATETDTAAALTARKLHAITVAGETDTAQEIVHAGAHGAHATVTVIQPYSASLDVVVLAGVALDVETLDTASLTVEHADVLIGVGAVAEAEIEVE